MNQRACREGEIVGDFGEREEKKERRIRRLAGPTSAHHRPLLVVHRNRRKKARCAERPIAPKNLLRRDGEPHCPPDRDRATRSPPRSRALLAPLAFVRASSLARFPRSQHHDRPDSLLDTSRAIRLSRRTARERALRRARSSRSGSRNPKVRPWQPSSRQTRSRAR